MKCVEEVRLYVGKINKYKKIYEKGCNRIGINKHKCLISHVIITMTI